MRFQRYASAALLIAGCNLALGFPDLEPDNSGSGGTGEGGAGGTGVGQGPGGGTTVVSSASGGPCASCRDYYTQPVPSITQPVIPVSALCGYDTGCGDSCAFWGALKWCACFDDSFNCASLCAVFCDSGVIEAETTECGNCVITRCQSAIDNCFQDI